MYFDCVFYLKNKGSSAKYEDELMPGSDEDTHDAYLAQVKAEGAEKDDDDSESSEGGKCHKIFFHTVTLVFHEPVPAFRFARLDQIEISN